MGEERGFLRYQRRAAAHRPVADRRRDFQPVELRLAAAEVVEQAARCLDCGTPFCHSYGCPLHNVIPEIAAHVYRRRWGAALAVLLETNSFPEFTGRVCPAPCEAACVLDQWEASTSIRQLELAVIEQAFASGAVVPALPRRRVGQSVAVAGSGPAGLAAADLLNRAGYDVVVYEQAPKAGGMLRYGIPDFKLEKSVLDRRLALMRAEGIVFETGVEVGTDVSLRFLAGRFAAVLLAGGARQPRDLPVPGRQLDGICFAMPYLVQQNRRCAGEPLPAGEPPLHAAGRRVVVIGGGDTGADCLGTALRQGARQVTQIEILPEPPPVRSPATPWPLWPDRLRESTSHQEGGQRLWSVRATEFVGVAGRVQQVRGIRVAWHGPDGRRLAAPADVPGDEFVLEADLVVLAMGFVGPGANRLVTAAHLQTDARGFVCRDAQGMSSLPGVFVAGDMGQGPGLVVRAMADGRRVAGSIAAWLQGGNRLAAQGLDGGGA